LVLILSAASAFAVSNRQLADAAEKQDWTAVAALVKQRGDVNAPQPDGTTALHWAAHWNDPKTVALLIAAGADVNAVTQAGVTALALACENGGAAIVDRLLQAGANANAVEPSGQTPLMVAAQTGNVTAVKALISHGANVNVTTKELRQTPLMWAASEGHASIVRVLIDSGANILATAVRGFTALMFAVRAGHLDAVKTLVDAGADVNEATPVMPAPPGGVGYHLGADHITVLPLAIANNHTPVALYLLEKGANPNQSASGMTALHHAVYGIGQNLESGSGGNDGSGLIGRVELVKALLKLGADPNARQTAAGVMGFAGNGGNGAFEVWAWGTNRVGATPFYLAADCSNANPELMRILLAAGANPNLTTEDGTTPLMASAGIGWGYSVPDDAARQRMLSGVRFLVEEVGADVNAANAAGFTALHGAAYKGSEQIIAYLVEHRSKMDVRDFRGRTPYRLAQWSRNSTDFWQWPKAAELLIKLGANPRLGVEARIQEREVARATQNEVTAVAAGAGGQP
jgi:ankyrin repeat protein